MANDNSKRFRVCNMDGSNVRFIEALGFEVESDSAGVIFYDVEDKLVARLFNVLVEPADASRESSPELVALAQRILATEPSEDDPTVYASSYNELLKDAKSLAGSVLSQAGQN